MALNFFKSLIPKVNAQEEAELVDPQAELREKCGQDHHAQALWSKYQECSDRVTSRSKTTETCTEELFDFLHHVDHCVSAQLMQRLK